MAASPVLESSLEAISVSEGLPSTRPWLLYFYFCAIVILYYDHLLTLPAEVAYIWRRPKSRSAYWFFLNRYLNFLSALPITVLNFVQFDHVVQVSGCTISLLLLNSSFTSSCTKYALFRQILLVVQVVVVDLILSLRVYAMYDLAAVWEALLGYDLLIFGIILSRTSQLWLRSRTPGSSTPLISLMQRDGALYFIAMTLANLLNIITFYVGGASTPLTLCVSVSMTSRLMLNLHALADRGVYSQAVSQYESVFHAQTLDTIFSPTLHSMAGPGMELEPLRVDVSS
ncbi:hypothetical protein FB451DRAFT_1394454 [Mycena latifolia]|nr:hypothetical protein FB451DRAFT_1394454 [Mycena latifolia]